MLSGATWGTRHGQALPVGRGPDTGDRWPVTLRVLSTDECRGLICSGPLSSHSEGLPIKDMHHLVANSLWVHLLHSPLHPHGSPTSTALGSRQSFPKSPCSHMSALLTLLFPPPRLSFPMWSPRKFSPSSRLSSGITSLTSRTKLGSVKPPRARLLQVCSVGQQQRHHLGAGGNAVFRPSEEPSLSESESAF